MNIDLEKFDFETLCHMFNTYSKYVSSSSTNLKDCEKGIGELLDIFRMLKKKEVSLYKKYDLERYMEFSNELATKIHYFINTPSGKALRNEFIRFSGQEKSVEELLESQYLEACNEIEDIDVKPVLDSLKKLLKNMESYYLSPNDTQLEKLSYCFSEHESAIQKIHPGKEFNKIMLFPELYSGTTFVKKASRYILSYNFWLFLDNPEIAEHAYKKIPAFFNLQSDKDASVMDAFNSSFEQKHIDTLMNISNYLTNKEKDNYNEYIYDMFVRTKYKISMFNSSRFEIFVEKKLNLSNLFANNTSDSNYPTNFIEFLESLQEQNVIKEENANYDVKSLISIYNNMMYEQCIPLKKEEEKKVRKKI